MTPKPGALAPAAAAPTPASADADDLAATGARAAALPTRRTAPAPVEAVEAAADRPIANVAGTSTPSSHPSTLIGYLAPSVDPERPDEPRAVVGEVQGFGEGPAPASVPFGESSKAPRADATEALSSEQFDDMAVGPPPAPKPPRADQTEALTDEELNRMSVTPPPAPKAPRADQTEALSDEELNRMSVTPPPAPRVRARAATPAVLVREDVDDEPRIAEPEPEPGPSAARWLVVPLAIAVVVGALYWAITRDTGTDAPAPSSGEGDRASSAPSGTSTPAALGAAPSASGQTDAAIPPHDAGAAPAVDAGAVAVVADAGVAPVQPASLAAPFDDARLASLAPMPAPNARAARLPARARATRVTAILRNTARAMRSESWDAASRAFNSALTYDPHNATALRGLARIALELEHWDVALAWCQRALAVDAEDAASYMIRGDALAGSGDRAAAREAWSKVLTLDPRNRDARARMRRR